MAEPSSELEGPDFEKGWKIDQLADGEMILGHAFGEAILAARHPCRRSAIPAVGMRRAFVSGSRCGMCK